MSEQTTEMVMKRDTDEVLHILDAQSPAMTGLCGAEAQNWNAVEQRYMCFACRQAIAAEERSRIAERIDRDMPVAVLATDGGPAVAYAMRVSAFLHEILNESGESS